ncbi:MAG: V-type ATP synthase subunit I [Eubacteriaceae bacterium]|jgi:V/A-type H+-transporting ATPase subunit I
MAVENVVMMNVVGKLKSVNSFAKDIFLFNDIQLVDAMGEIDSGRFTLPVTEKNIDELLGFANLVPGSNPAAQKVYEQRLDKLEKFYGDKLKFDPQSMKGDSFNVDDILGETDSFIQALEQESNQLTFYKNELAKTEQSIEAYSYLKDVDVPLKQIMDMKYFSYEIGSLTKDSSERLKNIYPSLTSVIFHIGDTPSGEEVFIVVTENDFKVESERVLKALNFKPVEGYDSSYTGTPAEILNMLKNKRKSFKSQIEVLDATQNVHLKNTKAQAEHLFNELSMMVTLNIIKTYMAFSENNFYFSGWIPTKSKDELKSIAARYPDMIMMFESPESAGKPPTKLQNNWLFRPFEQLVKMYGVPNYNEIDPTPFLSLTYMFCFGYMFGDVGQGIVLLLGGLLVEKKGMALGGVVARMACASILFGFIYGSVFGNETLLPALWLRPMEDINTLLITAVVLGVGMLIVAYIFGIINKLKQHNIDQGWFGKNGISGFVLYLLILVTALGAMKYIPEPAQLVTASIYVCVGITIIIYLQEPLTNLVDRYKFMHGLGGEYYVSSFFEIFEMFLSMLSNTLSFIRVGAFALTHAGMFLAFQTIANMAGGGIGGVIILIIGNIFIICLEGLIDFIQCLRLEFYELFGKYYEGNGIEFVPINQKIKEAEYAI